jgi:C4-dicarboxylate-specific signal transduction histidine kinase
MKLLSKFNIYDFICNQENFFYLIVDSDYRIVYVDETIEKFFPIETSDVDAQRLSDVFPEFIGLEMIFEDLIHGKEMRFALDCLYKNGIYFDISFHKIENEPNILVIFEDRSKDYTIEQRLLQSRNEKELLSNQLKELNATLERRVAEEVNKNRQNDYLLMQKSKEAALGEMIANIAHQWRQPLNALNLYIYSIKDSCSNETISKEEVENFYNVSKELIAQMSQTINDFKDFFMPKETKEHFSIRDSVDTFLNMFEVIFSKKEIQVKIEIDDVQILGYKNQLEQVLLNLVNNAKDAFDTQTIDEKIITIKSFKKEHCVVIEVIDNAGGIHESLIEDIFKPYKTTKKSGTGIGLYMSKIIIEKSFLGSMRVENSEDGARFSIEIPLKEC